MKSNFLLPNRFKPVGWIVFFIGFLLSVLYICLQDTDILQTKVFALFYNIGILGVGFCGVVENSILDEIAAVMIIIGGILIMFSKEKNEDEFVASLRLNALSWAVLIKCACGRLCVRFSFLLGTRGQYVYYPDDFYTSVLLVVAPYFPKK